MELTIAILIIAFVVAVCFGLFVWDASKKTRCLAESVEQQKPRISLPVDSSVYTFVVDSQLTAEEWQTIFNAGWEFVTCNTEEYDTYAGCYPEAPKIHRTRWHYVFRKNLNK